MMDDNEKLFSKNVNVLLKDYDQKISPLHITIYNTHTTAPGHRRELKVRLTNASDLLFLQALTLSEDDFQCLKNQQGLLVDFSAFPQKFIDLLELCVKDECSTSPRFVLHFTTGNLSTSQGQLEVVETNPFKHLVHLSLKFVSGTDEDIKNHLAACLKRVKDEKELLQKQLTETEKDLAGKLQAAQNLLREKIVEGENSSMQWQNKVKNLKEKYESEIQNEKEHNAQLRQTYETRLHDENRTSGDRYNQVVGDLETKLNVLQASNKGLTDCKYKYESLIRDLKSQVATMDEERSIRTKDFDKLRLENHRLDNERHERDKTLNHLKTRVAVLEQELKSKTDTCEKNSKMMETVAAQKSRLEVDAEKKDNHIAQLDNSLKAVSGEVVKGNEIIKKYQLELKALKQRVKVMAMVTEKQEKLIVEKDASLTVLGDEKKTLEGKVTQLTASADETSRQFTEAQETLKNNENVINWLNKQLNEQTVAKLASTAHTHNNNSTRNTNTTTARASLTARSNQQQQNSPFGYHNTTHPPSVNREPRGGGAAPPQNILPRTLNRMPYGGDTFVRPCFQGDNISPIVSTQQTASWRPTRNVLGEKTNSTPMVTSVGDNGPVLDPKYLMRPRLEKENNSQTPLVKCGGDENVDPKAASADVTAVTATSATPYIIPSSYFPTKGSA